MHTNKILLGLLLLAACKQKNTEVAAYGNFEATEIVVSAEATGKIMQLDVEEGDQLKEGVVVGGIDSTQLSLKKTQLRANIKAVLSKQPEANPQLEVVRQQILAQQKEQARIASMFKANAATQKQMDDINAAVAVLQKQYASLQSTLNTQISGLQNETQPIEAQVAQVNDQLSQSRIVNPARGTVLVKYAEKGEVVNYGKALYKIADLQKMLLRVYISARQLPSVKIGQQVTVRIDGTTKGSFIELPGTITWIASEAEFTPKVIQTVEERTQLVYAMKVSVENKEGQLKLGMPGEIIFK
ncbi:HlyD family secretion protein [Chitinophaga skermanii]|uniref:HlyD family secretion protein n=1 Tax=Chitinophaga skermanii TaxID=331697 RepID=A0A327QZ32_9BACT|nr:HlyD family efflux transporter periplasmic adaptor subunit [Chitinophaga skermanii]RAJ08914.1 HlyD family secretion protein [Chitinophaga skermanii]